MTLARETESFADAPPLHLRFFDVAAAVDCAQPALREALALLYAPAVEAAAAPATFSYRITPEGDIWQYAGRRATCLASCEQNEQLAHTLLFSALASRVRSHWLLHAAALSAANGGVLLAGSSGAGKTTLALALAQRGYGWHSDEVAALARHNGYLEPFPRLALLRPGTLRLLPQLHGSIRPWPLREDDAVGCWRPVTTGRPSPLRYVFLLDESEDEKIRHLSLSALPPSLMRRMAEDMELAPPQVTRQQGSVLLSWTDSLTPRALQRIARACCEENVFLLNTHAEKDTADFGAAPSVEPCPLSTIWLSLAASAWSRPKDRDGDTERKAMAVFLAELAAILRGARGYRLRPGSPEATATLVEQIIGKAGEQ